MLRGAYRKNAYWAHRFTLVYVGRLWDEVPVVATFNAVGPAAISVAGYGPYGVGETESKPSR